MDRQGIAAPPGTGWAYPGRYDLSGVEISLSLRRAGRKSHHLPTQASIETLGRERSLLDSEDRRLAHVIAGRQLDHLFLSLADKRLTERPANEDDSHFRIVILFLCKHQRLRIARVVAIHDDHPVTNLDKAVFLEKEIANQLGLGPGCDFGRLWSEPRHSSQPRLHAGAGWPLSLECKIDRFINRFGQFLLRLSGLGSSYDSMLCVDR